MTFSSVTVGGGILMTWLESFYVTNLVTRYRRLLTRKIGVPTGIRTPVLTVKG